MFSSTRLLSDFSRRQLWRASIVLGVFVCATAAGALNLLLSGSKQAPRPRDPRTGIIVGLEARDLGPGREDGATSAVLLLHGFLGSHEDFSDLGERLAAQGYHVREARLPGHGTTPDDFARQTPESMFAGADLEYRALKARYPSVSVGGFSMGGALATLVAAREGNVDRLFLASPYFGVTYEWYYILPVEGWTAALGWAVHEVPKKQSFIKVNRRDEVGKWFTYTRVPTKGTETLIALGREARAEGTLAAIHCPVLLVMSQGDEAASPSRARAAIEAMASAEKQEVWLTRSNHTIFWDYEREVAKTAVIAFLKEPDQFRSSKF